MMDEFTAVQRARTLVNEVAPQLIPCPVERYVEHVGAKLRVENDLPDGEPGYTMTLKRTPFITVNGNESFDRQRFTICHELGHIVLGLPSEHGDEWWSYRRRPTNEKLCDVFAAELLLPYTLFKPEADGAEPCFATLQELAGRFDTSLTATGSRYAAVSAEPCAFVLVEKGKVRYASRSPRFRDSGAWIELHSLLPNGSVAERARSGTIIEPEDIDVDVWLKDWDGGGTLSEEARHLAKWDQTLVLLTFKEDEVPVRQISRTGPVYVEGMRELDGELPWPSKSRRRK